MLLDLTNSGKCHKCFQELANKALLFAHIMQVHGPTEMNVVAKVLPLTEKMKLGFCHMENCTKQFPNKDKIFKHVIAAHGRNEFSKLIKNLPVEERPTEKEKDTYINDVILERINKLKCYRCDQKFPVKILVFDHIIEDHSTEVERLLKILPTTYFHVNKCACQILGSSRITNLPAR